MSHRRIGRADPGSRFHLRQAARPAARAILEALFFAAFVFAVLIAAQESGKGRWFMPVTDLWALFAWGPAAAIAAFWLASIVAAQAQRMARGLPLALELAALLMVCLVGWSASQDRHGLWREWTAMDNHFSNRLHRGYYFESWVGGAGVFAVFAAHLRMRLSFAAPERFPPRTALVAALPMALWALILLRQLWAPAPYFIG